MTGAPGPGGMPRDDRLEFGLTFKSIAMQSVLNRNQTKPRQPEETP